MERKDGQEMSNALKRLWKMTLALELVDTSLFKDLDVSHTQNTCDPYFRIG